MGKEYLEYLRQTLPRQMPITTTLQSVLVTCDKGVEGSKISKPHSLQCAANKRVMARQTHIALFTTLTTIPFGSPVTNRTTDNIPFAGWGVFILEILHRFYALASINHVDFSNCFGYLNLRLYVTSVIIVSYHENLFQFGEYSICPLSTFLICSLVWVAINLKNWFKNISLHWLNFFTTYFSACCKMRITRITK